MTQTEVFLEIISIAITYLALDRLVDRFFGRCYGGRG